MINRMRLSAAILVWLLGASALAVSPQTWEHSGEAQFSTGEFDATVVNSLGEITLSRKINVLMPSPSAPEVVSALVVDGQIIYAACGSSSAVYRIEGDKAAKFAEAPGELIACLLLDGDSLLAGTGGDKAGVYRIDKQGKVGCVWSDEKVKYVWQILHSGDGKLYAACGSAAGVYAIDPATGKGEAIYQPGEPVKNILSLALGKDGMLYAGTDENGLVVKIDPVKKTSRILLDTDEAEICALILDDKGGLYAAGSDVSTAGDGEEGPPDMDGEGGMPMTMPFMGPGMTTQPASVPSGPEQGPSKGARPDAPQSDVDTEMLKKLISDRVSVMVSSAPSGRKGPSRTRPVAPSGRKGPPKIRPGVPGPPAGMFPGMLRAMMRRGRGSMMSGSSGPPSDGEEEQGNAVYYIGPDGLVRTVFRRPVLILAMMMLEDRLILGVGNGGEIFSVSLDGKRADRLVDTDAKQVTALTEGPDGAIVFGTSNKGSVAMIGREFTGEGTFTSGAMDASQIARWGTVSGRWSIPDGSRTGATLSFRSGNVEEPDEKTWSQWTRGRKLREGFTQITAPAGRFLQYRLKLTSAGKATATVHEVTIIYQVANLAPTVASVTAEPSAGESEEFGGPGGPAGGAQRKPYRKIQIGASDPNEDELTYSVAFREAGTDKWIEIAEKLDEPAYFWDTRTVADGTYQIMVTASDLPSNPPAASLKATKTSDPVVVDNTAPLLRSLIGRRGSATILLSGTAVDASSRIVAIHYSLDSQDDWIAVLPKDGICDSGKETFAVTIRDVKPGPHRIAVRVADVHGNVGYGSVSVTTR